MKFVKDNKFLVAIFLLALFLRVYKLSEFPIGFHADEVRVAWNSLSIAKTGVDDWGNRLAFYYNTFGDYRPTGIFYLTIPSMFVLGENIFAVRFVSSLFGALSVLCIYILVILFLGEESKISSKVARQTALIASLLLAISPWHIAVSRATSEVSVSLFFVLLSFIYFIKGIKAMKRGYFFLSIFFCLVSFLLYHSVRLLMPMYFVSLFVVYRKTMVEKRSLGYSLFSVIVVLILTGVFFLHPGTLGRFKQVSDYSAGFFTSVRNEYASYFSFDFLVGDSARPFRYRVPGAGVVFLPTLLLFFLGLYSIAQKKFGAFPVLLLLISPVVSSLTSEDTPNLHRSLYMVVFVCVIAAYGFSNAYFGQLREKFFAIILLVLSVFSFAGYYYSYFHKGSLFAAEYRNFGAIELVNYLNTISNQGFDIYLTNEPDSIYPWYAYFNHIHPKDFNKYASTRNKGDFKYGSIVFTLNKCPAGVVFGKNDKAIVVDGPDCSASGIERQQPYAKVVHEIKSPSGKTIYRVWKKDYIPEDK